MVVVACGHFCCSKLLGTHLGKIWNWPTLERHGGAHIGFFQTHLQEYARSLWMHPLQENGSYLLAAQKFSYWGGVFQMLWVRMHWHELVKSFETSVSPACCLGFIVRWQKIQENTSYVADLIHDPVNRTVYHMSQSVNTPGWSSVTKVNWDSLLLVFRLDINH